MRMKFWYVTVVDREKSKIGKTIFQKQCISVEAANELIVEKKLEYDLTVMLPGTQVPRFHILKENF